MQVDTATYIQNILPIPLRYRFGCRCQINTQQVRSYASTGHLSSHYRRRLLLSSNPSDWSTILVRAPLQSVYPMILDRADFSRKIAARRCSCSGTARPPCYLSQVNIPSSFTTSNTMAGEGLNAIAHSPQLSQIQRSLYIC